MRTRTQVLVISPPFYSHAKPLAALGASLKQHGAQVTFACILELRHLADENSLTFYEFSSTSNRNTGLASATEQPRDDRERLESFLKATREGAVASLTSQARNRQSDMLHAPRELLDRVRAMCEDIQPDWCLIDQLNYPVTLALYCIGVPFASFVAGHPTDLPKDSSSCFGVPDEWPGKIHVDDAGLADLKEIARDVDRAFTSEFNEVIQGTAEPLTPVTSAFSFGSAYARVFNYPETASTYPRHAGRDLFIGHCTSGGDTLPDEWRKDIEHLTGRPRVLIVFGTFQWVHTDVMRTVHQGIAQAFPDASFVISAGDRQSQLADINGERTLVRDFVPQQALLSHMDLFVTHGGNNSFTESLVTGVPLLVLPFASDQFAVAHDVERTGLGRVLDPNHLRPRDVADAAAHALTGAVRERVTRMSAHVLSRGPSWAAEHLIRRMSTVDPSNL